MPALRRSLLVVWLILLTALRAQSGPPGLGDREGAHADRSKTRESAERNLNAARSQYEYREKEFLKGRGTFEILHESSRCLLQVQRANDKAGSQVAAFEAHFRNTKLAEAHLREPYQAGRITTQELAGAEWCLREAETLFWQAILDDARRSVKKLSAKELEVLWNKTADPDISAHYRAMAELVAASRHTVPFLQGKLRPTVCVPQQISRWITDLDDDRYFVRRRATQELQKLGEGAEPALRQALESRPSLEVRHRIEMLLGKLDQPARSPHRLREVRAVKVLEEIGTPAARQLLETLAKGAPEVWLTQEAKASLQRVAKRTGAAP